MLHAAAWTNVDGAEDDPQGAAEVNVGGTAHAAELGAPLVAYSTDYVFDGRKGAPYVESDSPSPQSAYGMTKLHGEAAAGDRAWVVRSSWLFGPTGHNFVRTMLRLGAERDEVAVVADQRGCPTYVGHLAAATRELVDAGAALRSLARRRRGRLHLGRLRRGDLRGDGPRLPGATDLDSRVRSPGAASGGIDPAQREGCPGASSLAGRPHRVPRGHRPRASRVVTLAGSAAAAPTNGRRVSAVADPSSSPSSANRVLATLHRHGGDRADES